MFPSRETRLREVKLSRSLSYVAPLQCALTADDPAARRAAMAADLAPCVIRTRWSAISRGTERLVFEGRVPASERTRMRAPLQRGEFPFPVVYGYAAVGTVEEGPPELIGRDVFVLAPHEETVVAPAAMAAPLPEATPPRRATLAANLETALNGLWDGAAGPGDRIAIVGGGVLGGLLAALAARLPGAEVAMIDPLPERAALAEALGVGFAPPEDALELIGDADLVLHTSATAPGLETALALAGDEARVVEMSWFGDARPALPLGAAFHSRRLRLVSSQVGQVAASRRARWSRRRRLLKALDLLRDPRFDALIADEVAFEDLPAEMPRVLGKEARGLATVVRYGAAG